MARIEIDPNYSSPTFSRATASTDLFKKEDVQALAAAISTHVHDGAGKGLAVAPGAATIPGSALTNGSVTLAKLAADSVDSSKIVDGTIATADLANASVTNAKLASDTARLNLLTNPGFEVWSRGVGPFTAAAAVTSDRWQIDLGGGSTISVTKTGTVDTSSLGALNGVYTHVAGSAMYQKIEDYGQLAGRTISLSMRVRTSTANAVRLTIYDSTNSWRYGTYHSGGGTYETLTLTVAIPAGVTLVQIGASLNASTTFQLDNAMLVVGSVAADYAPLHPADDLARCERYYELQSISTGNAGTCQALSAVSAVGRLSYRSKAVTPTITFSGQFRTTNASGTQTNCTVGTSSVTGNNAEIDVSATSGLVAGNATLLFGSTTTNAITMESNP